MTIAENINRINNAATNLKDWYEAGTNLEDSNEAGPGGARRLDDVVNEIIGYNWVVDETEEFPDSNGLLITSGNIYTSNITIPVATITDSLVGEGYVFESVDRGKSYIVSSDSPNTVAEEGTIWLKI